ncbi:MAG: Ryanodine receptor Ryr [Clostridia bacterium]|nr:Ryanodine receptor Ryr [Clostridia bacterium]
MTYTPAPVDTSMIELSKELASSIELFAKNTHENWSLAKINEGWTYGEIKDDIKKATPLLVPYEELPESEKEYDRILAVNVIKLLKKLGYELIKENRKL